MTHCFVEGVPLLRAPVPCPLVTTVVPLHTYFSTLAAAAYWNGEVHGLLCCFFFEFSGSAMGVHAQLPSHHHQKKMAFVRLAIFW
jgi:hypothetical protein